jgi:hypothetical protein
VSSLLFAGEKVVHSNLRREEQRPARRPCGRQQTSEPLSRGIVGENRIAASVRNVLTSCAPLGVVDPGALHLAVCLVAVRAGVYNAAVVIFPFHFAHDALRFPVRLDSN